ncbi:MAG: hypothetical protein BalsKO_16970 [Balneolaceae bacterium]
MQKSCNSITNSIFALGLALISLLLIQCTTNQKEDENVLAQINGLKITITHFENAFLEYYYKTGQALAPDISTKKAILDTEFNTYVLAVFAKDLGLDDSDYAKYQREAIKKRVINEEYLNQIILSDVRVTDKKLEEYFLRFNTQLRASHLFSRSKEGIESLRLRLEKGEKFEDLAKEIFSNKYMANNGGDIGRFTTDDLDIAFENTAFKMEIGEISNPIQTAQGYSIVKLTERISKPILTEFEFNERKGQLFSFAIKKEREIATRSHLNDFVEHVSLNDELITDLWLSIDKNYEAMLNKSPEFISNLQTRSSVIATYGDFDFTMSDLIEEYLISSNQMLNTIQDEGSFGNFIKGVAYRTFLYSNAVGLGIDKQDLVLDSIEETYNHFLADEANFYLKSRIKNTAAELYTEYQKNRSNFVKPLEINLSRIVVDSREKAELIVAQLENGASFEVLVKENTIKNEDLFTNGELGFESIKSYGFNSIKLAELEIGDISEVIQYQQNEFHIYKCLGRNESSFLSFAQAQDFVNDFLTKKKLQEIRSSTIDEVKIKHNAIVDVEKLEEITIQI